MATKYIEGWWGLALAVNDQLLTRIGESQMAHLVKDSGRKIGRRIGGKMFFTKEDVSKAISLIKRRVRKSMAVERAVRRVKGLRRRR